MPLCDQRFFTEVKLAVWVGVPKGQIPIVSQKLTGQAGRIAIWVMHEPLVFGRARACTHRARRPVMSWIISTTTAITRSR